MVTCGSVVVTDSGLSDAGAPVAGMLVTGPSPVAKIAMNSPLRTGRESGKAPAGAASVVVPAIRIDPWPSPVAAVVKIPGLNSTIVTSSGTLCWFPTMAVSKASCNPSSSQSSTAPRGSEY